MTVFILILIALILGLGTGLYFQMKAAHKQADEQQQLLKDYQERVNEQQKLLDDYRALEKNFDSVGEGYEQALLAFDKMEEENQKQKQAFETIEKRSNALQERLNKLEAHGQKSDEVIGQALSELRQMAQANGDRKLMGIVGRISDHDDVLGEKAVRRTDNVLVTQIVDEAVVASGIDRASYLTFVREVAPDAAATMLSTNLVKAVRALTHLLDNALKFTSEGKVTLRAAVDMDKMIAIYTVEDTGSGIAPDDAERIFEPYVKLNQFFDGQGVGLTVARNIARRLEGDVVLDSTYEGPGSRFVLTLPI